MSQFLAACFSLYVDPAHQQLLRGRLPIRVSDSHRGIGDRSDSDRLQIVDFLEVRLPITASADCGMEKEVNVLNILFLHLRGQYNDGADNAYAPKSFLYIATINGSQVLQMRRSQLLVFLIALLCSDI